MESSSYTTLTRQSGLMREMQVVANNIANAATTGYRQEGVVFSEYVQTTQSGPSLSMARAHIRHASPLQGAMTQTGGQLDMAIEGEGYFLIDTPNGERLSRAGNFALSAQGDLVTVDGYNVLDAGGAPIFIPPDVGTLGLSPDGTLSAGGRPLGQIGVVIPVDPTAMRREGGVMFNASGGYEPVDSPRIKQGFLEGANVDPVAQIARMIEVQRAYEMGQSFMDAENERVRTALQTFISSR